MHFVVKAEKDSGSSGKIVLVQNKFLKMLPLTGIQPVTLGL